MHILLTNDDGFDSPLLQLLCRAAAARGHRVSVSAPAAQQSAKSHSFTLNQPLIVHRREMEGAVQAWAVEGTPVDSARLGFMNLVSEPIDLVISGINNGENVGLATYVSGTVGAAREIAFQNKRAMAVSMQYGTDEATARFFADWVITVAEHYMTYPVPDKAVCNLNVPRVPVHELQPPVVCPLSTNVYTDDYEHRVSPRGAEYYWLSPMREDTDPTPGSDVDMLQKGHITCTFLTPEPCDQAAFADFFEGL
ncbi:MAG: 5'/3'-nucleotidase SurE [Clostridia bacterium]|nr:5'/3'-nucleotidase SurE [Clostridia bacterium]